LPIFVNYYQLTEYYSSSVRAFHSPVDSHLHFEEKNPNFQSLMHLFVDMKVFGELNVSSFSAA